MEDQESDIQLIITKAFEVEICVRGYHFYKEQPLLGEKLITYMDDDPMCLILDRYAVAVKVMVTGGKIGHVPKFMSKLTYYFIKHGGIVCGTVTGKRQYSWDLQQGGLQIPTFYTISCENENVFKTYKSNIIKLEREKRMNEKEMKTKRKK